MLVKLALNLEARCAILIETVIELCELQVIVQAIISVVLIVSPVGFFALVYGDLHTVLPYPI